jgi:hypothetical protein
MKKHTLILGAFILTLMFAPGCKGDDKSKEIPVEQVKEEYQCPMKCTEEIFDKPGKCPVCGMELERVAKS